MPQKNRLVYLLLLLCAALIAVIAWCCLLPTEHDARDGRWVDLTHDFDMESIYWPTATPFDLHKVADGITDAGFYYAANEFSAAEHGGTHMDAPVHFARGRQSAEQVPLSRLIGPGVVIDVSRKALKDPDYRVGVEDIQAWEKKHGRLDDNVIVLLRTGYYKYWGDKKKYMGTDQRGADAVPLLHFPGLHPDAAKWLVANRNIASIGLDTPSIDYGQSKLFLAHQILFDKQIPAFENVANMGKLPAKGFTIYALPMKIKGGSGAPLRIIARLP